MKEEHGIVQWYRKLDAGKILRMIADVLIVNFSLAVAVIAHYLWIVGAGGVQDASAVLRHHAIRLLQHSLTLTPTALVVFWWSGFYTHSRLYRGRYKAIIIAQAVTLVYVLAGFFAYLVLAIFAFQRTTLILGWLVTLVVCLAVRLGHREWKTFSSAERRYLSVPLADRPPRNVLVIGGAGYIGSALIPKLLEKGYYVRLLDLFLYGMEPIVPYINHPRLDIVRADIRQSIAPRDEVGVQRVHRALAGCEVVGAIGAQREAAHAVIEQDAVHHHAAAKGVVNALDKRNRVPLAVGDAEVGRVGVA